MRALLVALLLLAPAAAAADPPRRYSPLSAEERSVIAERIEEARAARRHGPPRPASGPAASARPGRWDRAPADRAAPDAPRPSALRAAAARRTSTSTTTVANVTRHTVVSLPSGTIESEAELSGVQLPLTQNEIARATGIALQNPLVGDRIQQLFREKTGEILGDLSQLHAKAMVFSSEAMPDSLNAQSQACGVNRCAQLLLYTRDHLTVEVIPIVDLSTGTLVQVLDF